jgi:hypothetical protein
MHGLTSIKLSDFHVFPDLQISKFKGAGEIEEL